MHKRSIGVVGFVLVMLLAACSGTANRRVSTPIAATATVLAQPQGRGAGDTLTILFWQAPTILNPHLTQSAKDWQACRITYEPLASYDKDGNLVPFLAAEIPSLQNGGVAADGKSVTWKLKPDVKWSDGQPFTAADVVFTYEFINNKDTGAATTGAYSAVEKVQALDDLTVLVTFNNVNPAWALSFVGLQGMIIPRHIYEPYNGENARESVAIIPVGTGPYKVVKFKTEEVLFLGNELIETNKIVFEPNPYFREETKPFFSRVELKGGGTVHEAARSVLQVGDMDYAYNLQLSADVLAELEKSSKTGKLVSMFGAYTERILLNRTDPNRATADGERSSIQFEHPFFSDKEVRQAFSLAINREAIAKLYGPTGRPTSNMLVSPAAYQSPNTRYEFDLKKAADLLDQAGWRDTDGDGIRDKDDVKLKVVFQTSVNALRQQTQEIVKKDLESIGVEVELEIIDSSVFLSTNPSTANTNTRWHFYADMEMYSTSNRSPDPGDYMKWWTCEERTQQANNWSGRNIERWCNPAYDALYKQSTTEMNPENRRQLFIQMNDMLVEDVVMIPLIHRADFSGVNNTIQGIDLTPWDAEFWNIKDWRRVSP